MLSKAWTHGEQAAHFLGQIRREDRALLLVLHLASQELLWGPRQPNSGTAPSRGSNLCVLGPLARTEMINASLREVDYLLTPSR